MGTDTNADGIGIATDPLAKMDLTRVSMMPRYPVCQIVSVP